MGLFKSKEIECTCLRCGSVWYTTKKEVRESKRLKREIKMAKFDNTWRFHSVRTHRNNVAQIAFMESVYADPFRCSDCGSTDVEYCYVESV